jgi:RHS repeat-associated protein
VTQMSRLATTTTAAATRTITYDANGYIASQTDWNGNLTTYINNTRGQPTSITEGSGTPQARTTTIAWDPVFHLPTKIVEPGLTTDFVYDASGNPLTRTLTDSTTTTVPYATSGTKRVWTYTWSNGLLASAKGPRTDVSELTSFAYDSSGALIKATNALGQQIQVTQHTPGGLPQTIVDPNNVTTQFTYDARLRLKTSTIGAAAGPLTTAFNSDAAGNLLSVTLPDSSALTNAYDAAHRLTSVTDLFNQQAAYTLDALGDRTQTTLADSTATTQLSRSSSFDALGRLLQNTGGAGQVTTYTYDGNGNALTIADPLSRVTHQSFDSLNRLNKVTDAAGGIAGATFDAHDRPLTVTAPNGAVTSYIYDGFGDIIQTTSPDTGMTVYRYDLSGNQTQKVDATGATANYTYDALDRVLTAAYPAAAAENAAYKYDETGHGFGVGRLTSVTDAAGTLTRSYDERGNMLKETRTNGAAKLATSYTYDAASRVASIAYPSGWTAAYTRDAMGRTTAVTAQAPGGAASVPVLTSAGYQPFGPINGLTFGNGVAEARTFDLDYRLTDLADAGTAVLQNLAYAYDAANNVLSITDGVTAGNSQTLGYDAIYRLTSASGGYGNFGYTYDASGNRMSETAATSTTAYAYTARTNQLASVTAGAVRQAIGYDKAGHINSFNPAAGAITNVTYNQSGRLATVMAGSSLAAQYTYDGFGQRLVKVGAVTGTTLYQYDQSGHLLEETDGQGNALADYIYVGGLPVATVSPGAGQVYFLHDDRLGTPQSATDSGQNVVWTASYGPFGEMSSVPALVVQDLRLPGQELDADTGLYHNGFRDYAPGWGRYLQSDPIGLAGGMNTYGYVGGNPVNWVDRLGLEAFEGNFFGDEHDVFKATHSLLDVWDWVTAPGEFANGLSQARKTKNLEWRNPLSISVLAEALGRWLGLTVYAIRTSGQEPLALLASPCGLDYSRVSQNTLFDILGFAQDQINELQRNALSSGTSIITGPANNYALIKRSALDELVKRGIIQQPEVSLPISSSGPPTRITTGP